MKVNNVTKVLEPGAGHCRDTIFFASNGIVVDALDYSTVAVNILDRITKKKKMSELAPEIKFFAVPAGFWLFFYKHSINRMPHHFLVPSLTFLLSYRKIRV